MLLAINIGNTHINCGVFKEGRLRRHYTFSVDEKNYDRLVNRIADRKEIDAAILCSVLPRSTERLVRQLKKRLGKKVYVITRDILVPIKNLYKKPKRLGQDRLVNAYAGVALYGAPLIVVDFGTAITFDVVSKNKEYLGGIIVPGAQVSLDALAERAALLPKITLKAPGSLIGRDTEAGMLSGIVYGLAALTDCFASKIKKVIGNNARVVATGGDSVLLSRYAKSLDVIDTTLTLKGLNLAYLMNLSRL